MKKRKEKKKHILLKILLVVLVLYIISPKSSNSNDGEQKGTSLTLGSTGTTIESNGKVIYSTNQGHGDNCPTIEKKNIYYNNSIAVNVDGIEFDTKWDTYNVKLVIHNDRPSEISYLINYADINGYTVDAYASGNIYPNMDAPVDLSLSYDSIKLSGIDRLMTITFYLELHDNESNEELDIARIELDTSDSGTAEQEYSFEGNEIFNNGIIRVYAKLSNPNSMISPLTFYIENNSETGVQFSYNNVAYNNQMVAEYMSGNIVLPHSHRIEKMNMFFFGNEPEIDTIENVTMKLGFLPIRTNGSFSTADLYYSNPFTITK